MRQKRVLVYAEAPAASPTFQIRIAAPLDAAGIEIIYVDDLKSRELIDVVRTDVDAVIVHRGTRKRCKVYTILREAARKYDKPLIYDVDDLLIHVPRTHPHYQVYQSRAMGAMRTLVNADLVIASTSVLADYLRHFHANVLTIPNRLPELLWRSARQQSKEAVPARHRDSQITLGYVGTASHLPDLQSIQGALTTVLERYHDRVRFVAVGVPLPSALGSHPLVTCITPPRALRSNYAAFAAFSARLPIDCAAYRHAV